MKNLLLVFIGGGIGSCLRYLVTILFLPLQIVFPLPTLISNVLACFIVGFIGGIGSSVMIDNQTVKTLIIIGFCGGLSTFSSFMNENFQLIHWGAYGYLFLNIILTFSSTFISFMLGSWIGKTF